MPEGDTVWLTAQRLDAGAGRPGADRGDLRVPQLATADLTGDAVIEVVARGKHLLTRFDAGLTLHTPPAHGRHVAPRPRRASGRGGSPSTDPRRCSATPSGSRPATGCTTWSWSPPATRTTLVGHLGPDLLGPDWDLDEAVRRLRRATRTRAIGEALLDQRNLAGIGNLYKCEALFVEPRRPVDAGGRGAPTSRPSCAVAAAAARQPRPPRAVDDRLTAAGPGALGLRAGGRALPALPHPDPPAPSRALRHSSG